MTTTLTRNKIVWIGLNTALAKLHFTYDLELLIKDLDWHRGSRTVTFWQNGELRVRVARGINILDCDDRV